jgi:hypothetical protein
METLTEQKQNKRLATLAISKSLMRDESTYSFVLQDNFFNEVSEIFSKQVNLKIFNLTDCKMAETAVEELHYPIHFFCIDGRASPFHRTFVTIHGI